ncbi:ATP-binding protein [Dongia deserti]|uniref:ATP-binding protein n=1 Tax=Dongia deserti TaxID=2268030 RepID=UPI000E65CB6A|nr:ATP-binding protein [Dongia deserti]
MLRRLVPHSMLSWFALVLAAGISLSLISVSAFHAFNRDEAIAALEDLRAAERIAAVARFLDHSAPPLRPVIAESISGSSLFIAATPASMVDNAHPPDNRTARLRDVIAARLIDMRWRDLRVNYGIGPDSGTDHLWSWIPSLWSDEHKRSDQILSLQDRGETFTVSLQLLDGTWLNFSFASVKSLPFSSWSHLLALALGIIAVMALGIGAMRVITRPIASLANAAEQLGRGAKPGDVPVAGLDEVRQAARAFNQMQRRIRRMIEDRTQMIAAISHDLRTPITRLRLRAEFVEDAEEQQKMLTDLDQMEAIIRSTLMFAREDSDNEPTADIDLQVLLQEVAESHPPARLTTREACSLRGRPVALRRCFNNLVENAVRYGNTAEIALHDRGGAVEVTVDDTGPGIPEDRLNDVFRPFVRLEESRNRESGGAGLGLAIARSVVLAHGGTIVLSNRAEGGLRVLVRLPKAG